MLKAKFSKITVTPAKAGVPYLLLLLLIALPLRAAPLGEPGQEARAVRLGGEIRCTVCRSESIEDSSADMARDMRQLVRDKIALGWSDRQILDFLRARYGDFILLRPPVQANTYALWLAPGLIFAVAAAWVALFIRRGWGRRA